MRAWQRDCPAAARGRASRFSHFVFFGTRQARHAPLVLLINYKFIRNTHLHHRHNIGPRRPSTTMSAYDMNGSPAPEGKGDDSKKISFRFCREWYVLSRE